MKYFIGIDNSHLDHKVNIIDCKGKNIIHFIIQNDLSGFRYFEKRICKYRDVIIGFEIPHGPLVDFLQQKGYSIYSLNPLKIKRFKESYIVSGNKNDKVDSEAIARYLMRNYKNLKPMMFNSPKIERLKMFVISYIRLTKEHTRYANKLIYVLRQYFPLYNTIFRNSSSKIQLKMIIKYPTLEDLKGVGDDEVVKFLKQNHYRNPKYIEKVINKIHGYEHIISFEVEQAFKLEAITFAKILLTLKDELNNIEKQMSEITNNNSLGKYFKSLPGSGDIISSKLLAIFGDVKDRFNDANGVQCLFGTAPRNYQSGPYHKVIMRKACNKMARDILYKYAFSSLRYSVWARNYYDEQRKKGKTNSVALRALSNKWVKIIYKIWKDEIYYQENKLLSVA